MVYVQISGKSSGKDVKDFLKELGYNCKSVNNNASYFTQQEQKNQEQVLFEVDDELVHNRGLMNDLKEAGIELIVLAYD